MTIILKSNFYTSLPTAFREAFDEWTMDQISKQLKTCMIEDVKLDMRLSIMKPQLCGWLYKAWKHIDKKELIQVGWEKCGITRAFDSPFQAQALQENMTTPLFRDNIEGKEAHVDDEEVEDIEPTTTIEDVMLDSIARIVDKDVPTPSSFSMKRMAR